MDCISKTVTSDTQQTPAYCRICIRKYLRMILLWLWPSRRLCSCCARSWAFSPLRAFITCNHKTREKQHNTGHPHASTSNTESSAGPISDKEGLLRYRKHTWRLSQCERGLKIRHKLQDAIIIIQKVSSRSKRARGHHTPHDAGTVTPRGPG